MSEQSLSLIGRNASNRKVIRVRDVEIGGHEFVAMAGPCSVESRPQIMATAKAVKTAGARILRGGAFKPRTSPYDFQGLGIEALELLAEASEATGLPVITEVMDTEDIQLICQFADILQVGARNMQNFALLKKLGRVPKPILLKRGFCASIREVLLAAEYIAAHGNTEIILCERGIRTFETATRNTLDLSAVPVLNEETSLPVIVDPSHAAGKRSLVPALARAAVAVGADGLLIEVHPNPAAALSDGPQSLDFPMFADLMTQLKPLVEFEKRVLRSSSDGSGNGLRNNEPEFELVPA
ncbi:MAG TPA: 3-deoxy-7-phosphoheptulonate synthase [Pyrinomonadaceae bacterium]|jgi:3-deoxy-7-phosphoheptulonate synthase|nr:3-deoxy-7-phosphoheptulonate synthase [Pyrinomonadaceae bacterium]